MKALYQSKYGGPEVLSIKEVDKPTPKPNEVLIKVERASLNPLDWHFMRGTPRLMRLASGFFTPKANTLGSDVAGVVEAVGSEVDNFKVGDRVFGGHRTGGFAEYVCITHERVGRMPDNLAFDMAASIPIAGITALQSIRDICKVKEGDQVLINGSTGGVGTFGIQMAKLLGAEVTAVCSTQKTELVKSLGADHVVDYKNEDFTKSGKKYDVIIDNCGNRTANELRSVMKDKSHCAFVGFTSSGKMMKLMMARSKGEKKMKTFTAEINTKDLEIIADWIVQEKIKVIIDRSYPLEEAAAAIAYLEEGHATGKIILDI